MTHAQAAVQIILSVDLTDPNKKESTVSIKLYTHHHYLLALLIDSGNRFT